MKFPKITKFLPLVLALAMTTSVSMADPITGEANYQLKVDPYFSVTPSAPASFVATEQTGNYTGLKTKAELKGSFLVVSNTNTKNVYVYATCNAATNSIPALGGTDASALRVVFTNTTNTGTGVAKSTAEQIEALRAGTATDTDASPNAFVMPITISAETAEGVENGPVAGTLTDNNLEYVFKNGRTTITCTIPNESPSEPNTFSTVDTDGTYTATLYVSDTAQP